MTSSNTHLISEEPLEELLLSLEAREESVVLSVSTRMGEAQIRLDRGRLALAIFGNQLGETALSSLLLHREGSYRIERASPEPGNLDELPQLGPLVRERQRKATQAAGTGRTPALRMFGTLTRTPKQLPTGLSAVELRTLSAVDGRTSSLNIVRTSRDSAPETLNALREIIRLGLVADGGTASISPTLTMGSAPSTPVPPAKHPSAPSASAQEGPRSPMSPLPPSRSPHSPPPSSRETDSSRRKSTGRWAKAPNKRGKLNHTGYSSVPPAALAADHVVLPSGLREPVDQDAHNQTGTVNVPLRPTDPRDDELLAPSARMIPEIDAAFSGSPALRTVPRRDTPTALSNATVRPERNFPAQSYQVRESEMPVPSSRLDQATLDQLGELNAALQSSRKPNLALLDGNPWERALDSSPNYLPPSEPGPPSSLGLGLPIGELPSPGSVPHPRELPGEQPSSETSDLPRVGRYEVLARLKRGGMGSVYMCRLTGTAGFRRLFAMKVLHGHLAEQRDSLEAFFHEARVLGGLHHPNIVGIADVGTPHEPYIVMDYVEGGSLAELFRATSAGRDPALVISVIIDALHGLSYAHLARDEDGEPLELVHCDVTPHNLLVGIDGTCRVTDFGIARTRREAGDPGIIQGKPGYLAPERLRNAPADHRSDVFSMGVVLYAGLTGVEPFRGATVEESSQLILHGRVQPPSKVGLRPPPALDWVCMKALAPDPNARFASAEEMSNQLRRIADREQLIASTSEVGSWVKASLGPTLAARRAASLRGTGHTDPPPPVSPSVTPPRLIDERRITSDAPSALETTGPIEAPSSHSFGDHTEIIRDNGAGRGTTVTPTSRLQKVATVSIIAAGLATVAWAVLSPTTFARFFKMQELSEPGQLPQSGEPAQSASPVQPSAEQVGTSSANIGTTDKSSAPGAVSSGASSVDPAMQGENQQVHMDDSGKIVLPRIRPSGEE